jgi:hypothetical protein
MFSKIFEPTDNNKLDDILLWYSEMEFNIFPVSSSTKVPCIKDCLNKATSDFNQLISWADQFPGCNWGLSLAKSNLVAIDVDIKNNGMIKWKKFISNNGEPDTLKQITGSGGFHYIFKSQDNQKYKGLIEQGIDIKHNGFIVIYPSINSEGKSYVWNI